jgi:hypothetical protein
MTYYDKYLKYKKKYLLLQQQFGGTCTVCPKLGFHQNPTKAYKGTCANDTKLTLLLYSDDLSENIQNMFNAIIKLNGESTLEEKMTYEEFKINYEKLINSDEETKERLNVDIDLSDNIFFMPLNIDETDYDYFYDQGLKYIYNVFLRYHNDKKDILHSEKKLQRQASFQENEACMNNLLNITNINAFKKYLIPATNKDTFVTISVFNYFLMRCKKKFINIREIYFINDINQIIELKELITLCSNAAIDLQPIDNENSVGHLNGFIKCNNIEYFYDDNGIEEGDRQKRRTIVEFEWKKKLISICDNIIDMKITENYSDIFTRELFSIDSLKLNRYNNKIEGFSFIYTQDFINGDEDDLYLSNYFTDYIINNIKYLHNYYSNEIFVIYERLIYYENNNVFNFSEDFWSNFWYYRKKELVQSKNYKIIDLLYNNYMVSIYDLLKSYLTSQITVKEFDEIIKKYNDKSFDIQQFIFDAIDCYINDDIDLSIIEYIIVNGGDINYKNIHNQTPLIYLITKSLNNLGIVKKERIHKLIDYFIANNADLHIMENRGKTVFEISIDPDDNINNVNIAKKIYEKDNTTFTNIKDKICKDKNKYMPLIKIFITNELCKI